MFKPVESVINFVEMEKKWLRHWYETGIIEKYLHKNDASVKRFSFMDGPITANNPMGVHHAWGRTYKDLWQKFYNLLGYKQRFQNGFDCQGLWVEVEVEKELGLKSKKDIENLVPGNRKDSIAKFVELCKQRVYKFSGIQTEQSKRLAYFMNWDNSYFTMSPENNFMIWYFLKICYENGWIYKGRESVPWCPRCETAISQHEMLTEDYKQITHDSIYLELPIIDKKNEYLLVWTTTPWTIPANIAVAVDEKLDYSLVQGNTGDYYWVANALIEPVFKGDYKKIVKNVKGKELVGLKYKGPFDDLPAVAEVATKNSDKFHVVVATDDNIMPISVTEGTGMVHTAVSAGIEDFKLGKKYGLPMIPVIADNADYLPNMSFLAGKNAKKHPEIIINYLQEREKNYGENWVFAVFSYSHRYPACWRCKTELVWKIADEWYISMDSPSKSQMSNVKFQNLTLRERMIDAAKKIKWMPEFGLDRELDWLKNMHDWLISKKNRYWGLALPIYECEKCKSFEVIGGYDELKEKAVEGWKEFEGHTPHKPFIDEVKIKCSKCNEVVTRIDDVGNPWLDAGIVPFSTLIDPKTGKVSYLADKNYFKEWFPADFITESFPGQFKNWFYAMIAMSTVLEDTNPYKTVLGFGTLLGEDGRPMHKSWGNSIEFNEGADKIGVDVMRWMYSRQNPADNMLFGYKKADEVRRQFYLMLWNSYKYFVDYAIQDELRVKSLEFRVEKLKNVLDMWIVNRFVWLVKFVEKSLKQYNAKDAALEIEKFVSDLSTWYIRRSRDRVGASSDNKEDKEEFYSTLNFIFTNLSIILSPFMPFVAEKIYKNLTENESVHLAVWPNLSVDIDENLINEMQTLREVTEVGHRVRKEKSLKVRQPLAKAIISLPRNKTLKHKLFLSQLDDLIKGELNVKDIEWKTNNDDLISVDYDTNITEELRLEGELRDLIRSVQSERKEKNIRINQTIELVLPEKFKKFEDLIKKRVNAKEISYGDELKIEVK
ncbi:MAG: isoleucine--tRNA ligase [Candidatus Roizmanbacteria bacterium]|nr:MAG: isoleucine--tRNA ligase [Candidatus Roizmanbacteria bacterium]